MAHANGTPTPVLHSSIDEEKGLNRTSTAVTMSPELFEKLYLTPKVPHIGDNLQRFANPTPLGFMGLVIASFSFAMVLMGWGGASGAYPIAGIFFFGPMLLIIAMIFEWIMGNFFPMMVMGLFSAFWLSFGLLQLPTLQLAEPYATGAAAPAFNAALALFLLVWGFALLTFFVFSLQLNVVFALIFLCVDAFAFVMSGAYWELSKGDAATAGHLQTAGGALLFVTAALGWYVTFIIMAGEMRFPLTLPVGDLSHLWPQTNVNLAAEGKRD